MKRMITLAVAALFGAAAALSAQEGKGITKEVFYLMPDMARGSVYFNDRAPATGDLNICAVDNTVRYKDKYGAELAVEIDETLTRVVIDGVIFVPYEGVFLRLYPCGEDVGVAVRRNVLVLSDGKMASYGMESNTTAVTSIVGMSTTGKVFSLEDSLEIPYRMSQVAYVYRDGNIMTLNKRNLQRCFPNAKARIDAWFSENKKLENSDIEKVLSLCREWSE